MTRFTTSLAALAAAAALTLTGCGTADRLVHLQDAPTEQTSGAPLREEAAVRIATRVLAEAAAAEDDDEREAVIYGPAMRVTDARVQADVAAGTSLDVVVPETPTVLAVSDGAEWPRAILASDFDEETQIQSVHILISTGPEAPFRLYATAPMFPGTSVPSLGDFADGADFERAEEDEPIDASEILADYAEALAFPDPDEVDSVKTDDQFAESVKKNAQALDDDLDDLADLTQTNEPIADSVITFRTADGGHLIFGQMVRKDTITLTDQAKELTIDDEVLQELSGKEKVTEKFQTETLNNLLFIQPAEGAVTLVGAEEIVLRASGE